MLKIHGLILLIILGSFSFCTQLTAEEVLEALPVHLREGFVVWESNRSGAWRIYRKSLSGGEAEQISPDEEGRDHFAAHISPAGTQVVYLSFPQGLNGYRKHEPDVVVPMYLIDLSGETPPRKIQRNARPYGEHRSAVWVNEQELITIDEQYYTCRLDLRSGEQERILIDQPPGRSWDHGYLVDATGQYAFSGLPGFFHVDLDARRVRPRQSLPGCQPNVTRDAVWGYWMQGMGGPINRYHLASGQTGTILHQNDPRMPEGRRYLYFPSISPRNQLLVFAASPGKHDHHKSDYDLFLAPLNPDTLELNGDPVQFTHAEATDRFPEVFVAPLHLGIHSGKAPFTIHFEEDQAEPSTWSVNGEVREGPILSFPLPGQYLIEEEKGEGLARGVAYVHPARAPVLQSAVLRRDGSILLTYNEAIRKDTASFSLNGAPFEGTVRFLQNELTLILESQDSELADEVVLGIEGIRDQAQHPNVAGDVTVELKAYKWPVTEKGLVFLWEDQQGQQEFYPSGAAEPSQVNLSQRHRARYTAHGGMMLDKGAFLAPDLGAELLEIFQDKYEISIEFLARARRNHQRGPARIITFSTGIDSRNFTLGQEGNQFALRLRTENTSVNANEQQLNFGRVDTERLVHLLVTYRAGELKAYVDGVLQLRSDAHEGGFSNWELHSFLFGEESDGSRGWDGVLEGVAIYSRALSEEEATQQAEAASKRLAAREPVPSYEVQARLIAATPVPSLAEIDPYRSIMVVHEYEVERQISGPPLPERIRVYHWGLLDTQVQELPASKKGQKAHLQIEPIEAHPHLLELFPADTLELDFDIPVFIDTAP